MTERGNAPILDRDELARRLEQRRQLDGSTVALANGCFDVLHLGHVRFLEGAAAEADLLVVGVNTDDTVRALKGEGRPVQSAEDRASLVAALRPVDYVTIFSEPTADQLIEKLRPEVHCKGTDYSGGVPEERNGAGASAPASPSSGDRRFRTRPIFCRRSGKTIERPRT